MLGTRGWSLRGHETPSPVTRQRSRSGPDHQTCLGSTDEKANQKNRFTVGQGKVLVRVQMDFAIWVYNDAAQKAARLGILAAESQTLDPRTKTKKPGSARPQTFHGLQGKVQVVGALVPYRAEDTSRSPTEKRSQ